MQLIFIHAATPEPPTKFLIDRKGDLQISLFHAVQQHVDQIFIVSEGKRGNHQPNTVRELFQNRIKVPQRKVGEGKAANAAQTGGAGKRRRKEGNVRLQVRRENIPQQSLDILNLLSFRFILAIWDD